MEVGFYLGAIACVVLLIFVYWRNYLLSRRRVNLIPEQEFVVISGCDSGIGHYCARLLDKLGFRVVACCLFPDGEGAKRLADLTSPRLTIVHLDVTSNESVEKLGETVARLAHNNGVWALVNNAGVMCYGEFAWLTWKQCEQQLQVNLLGAIRLTKALLPLIKTRKGRILTMSSINGQLAYPAQAVYCASKFGLEGFCNSLRLEMKKHDVQIVTFQMGDFARLTNIMSGHEEHVKEMWQAMSEELKEVEGDYFKRFHEVVQVRHGLTSPKCFENSRLNVDLTDFVLSTHPQSQYFCMPFVQRCFFKLLLMLPPFITDRVLIYVFSKIFSWKTE